MLSDKTAGMTPHASLRRSDRGNPRRRLALMTALVVVGLFGGVGAASASVGAAVSKQASLIDGEKVTVSLSGVPAGQGVYVRQCYQASRGQRDTTGLKCNGSIQQTDLMAWATMDGARGSQPATAPITLTLRESVTVGGVSYPCGARDCSIFVYRDHRGLFDPSLDTVLPLMFLIEPTLRLRPLGLAADGDTVKAGTSVVVRNAALRTTDDARVNLRSATPKVCSVTKGSTTTSVRYLRAGTCTLSLKSRGDMVVTKNLDVSITHTVN